MKHIIEKYGLIPIRENANCEQIHIFINGFMSEEENNNRRIGSSNSYCGNSYRHCNWSFIKEEKQ